jgi:hypothetical protein
MDEGFSKVRDQFATITDRENSLQISFGQLTALASTPVGQAIGI